MMSRGLGLGVLIEMDLPQKLKNIKKWRFACTGRSPIWALISIGISCSWKASSQVADHREDLPRGRFVAKQHTLDLAIHAARRFYTQAPSTPRKRNAGAHAHH